MWILQAESCSSTLSPLRLQASRQESFAALSGKPAPFTLPGFEEQTSRRRQVRQGQRTLGKDRPPRLCFTAGSAQGFSFARGYVLDVPSSGRSLPHSGPFGNPTPSDGLDCWRATQRGCHPRLRAVWFDGLSQP